jgi:hypothetical protein
MLTALLVGACGGGGGGGQGIPCGPGGSCPAGRICDPVPNTCILAGGSADAAVADAYAPDAPPPDASMCANLLVNGGFELPAIAGNPYVFSVDPAYLPAWTLSAGGNQFFIENGAPFTIPRHSEGAQAICLNGDGAANVFVEQSFATTSGQPYTLTLWMTDEQVAGPTATAVRVDVAGMSMTFDRTGDTGYAMKTLSFVATSSTTTLRLSDASPGSIPGSSPFIDDVVVRCGN